MQISDTDILIAFQILFPFIISIAVYLTNVLISKLPAPQQAKLRVIVGDAVAAVEQLDQAVPGPNKKAEAQRLVSALMQHAGINASQPVVDTLIESAVYTLNQQHATVKLPAVQK